MELQNLRMIGLTKGEIKVYEALLELGDCTKTSLAKKSGIAPSNIYDVTNRLVEKGIISKIEKNGKAHFSPSNPRHIFNFLESKEKEIQKEKYIVSEMLPSLLNEFQKNRERIHVEVFQGWKGMKTVFDDLLDECDKGDSNYIFGASIGHHEKKSDDFFLRYSRKRANKGIITNIVFNEVLRKKHRRIDFFKKSNKYNVKFLQQSTPAEIMLYKNKSCIIILTKEPLLIRMSGKEIYDSFKQYFDIMWEIAKL